MIEVIFIAMCIKAEKNRELVKKVVTQCSELLLLPIVAYCVRKADQHYQIVITDHCMSQSKHVGMDQHVVYLDVPLTDDVLRYTYHIPFCPQKLYKCLVTIIQEHRPWSDNIVIDGKPSQCIRAEDIYYVETEGRKIAVVTKNGRFYSNRIFSIWERLLSRFTFEHCYRGIMVNLKYVRAVSSSLLFLNDGTRLPISRRRYQRFYRNYNRLRK
ncbi:LytTR family transcriptional regulator [Erysipelothrix piscisicarius]|uniref:LytTR family transcriptional regulator n=1 Tax=Erysipelothrix piscisicarius TaxID=2485784 RepID=A0A3Q8S887_9FIRM|nr:LytTR family DNA-binding domain-containing protein [Erysipelothrix piscisicarius]AZK44712.1 LytTR family transcriptional regulator [Erysipelothrix piscisicarius]